MRTDVKDVGDDENNENDFADKDDNYNDNGQFPRRRVVLWRRRACDDVPQPSGGGTKVQSGRQVPQASGGEVEIQSACDQVPQASGGDVQVQRLCVVTWRRKAVNDSCKLN